MSALSVADRLAHLAAQGSIRNSEPKPAVERTVLERFPVDGSRWPAERFAADRRRENIPARAVLEGDSYLVIVEKPVPTAA